MLPYVTDSASLNKFKYNYYYSTAHYFDIKHKEDSSLVYLDSAYNLNTKDLLLQELVENTVLGLLPASLTLSVDVLAKLDEYFKRFPFLSMDGRLGEYYVWALSYKTSKLLESDKWEDGNASLMKLINLMQQHSGLLKKTGPYYTEAFLQVYYYYIRNKKYKEAKNFLEKTALKYLPDNEDVIRRITSVNTILSNS